MTITEVVNSLRRLQDHFITLIGGRKWWRIAILRRRVLNTEGVRSTSAGTCRGSGAAATVQHQQCFTRHVSLVPHVVDVVEVLACAKVHNVTRSTHTRGWFR